MESCSATFLNFVHWLATDVSPIVQAVAAVAGLMGLWFVYLQIRDSRTSAEAQHRWAKKEAAYALIDGVAFVALEKAAREECQKLGIKFPSALTREQAKNIRTAYDAYFAVKAVMVTLEKVALAYNQEYSEQAVIERTYGPSLVGYWHCLEEYVAELREQNAPHVVFLELELAVKKIEPRIKSP